MSMLPFEPLRRTTTAAAVLTLTLLASACATTATRDDHAGVGFDDAGTSVVADGSGFADDAGNVDGAVGNDGAPIPDGAADTSQTAADGGSRTAGGGIGSGGNGGGGTGGSGTGSGGSGTAQVRMGPGVTAKEVRIGFEVSEGLTEAFGAVGFNNGGEVPKEEQIVLALTRWLNKRGGIRGRTVVPVIHKTNPTSGSFSTQAQAACSTFTEDNQVFAAGSAPAAGSEVLAACMASKRTPFLAHNYWPFGEQHFRQWAGYFYQPGRASGERHWAASVDALAAAGFFQQAKVGIVHFDAPHFRHLVKDVVVPSLARHGVKAPTQAAVSTIYQASDVSKVSAEANNIILRFRAEGVTHVLFVEYQGTIPFFFLPQAETQSYRPAYGLVSSNNPSTVAKQSPAAQLQKVMGVGWNPSGDTLKSNYHPNATAVQCETAMREGGYAVDYSAAGFYLYPHCDTLLFLKAAIERAEELTPQGLAKAVANLGDSYLSPQTIVSRFGPGRADGSNGYRLFAFNEACACFAYRGPVRPLE